MTTTQLDGGIYCCYQLPEGFHDLSRDDNGIFIVFQVMEVTPDTQGLSLEKWYYHYPLGEFVGGPYDSEKEAHDAVVAEAEAT